MDLNYQLGILVGEHIILTQLPSLSTDDMLSNIVIEVSEEDTAKWNEMRAEYIKIAFKESFKEESTKLFYEHRKWYIANVIEKYLPETVDVVIPKVEVMDMEEFKRGIDEALWDCDMSHYKVVDGFLYPNHPMSRQSRILITRDIGSIPERYQ